MEVPSIQRCPYRRASLYILYTGLLGTPKEEIEKALTVRVVAAKRDVVRVKTNLSGAIYARDALAKVINTLLAPHAA